MSNDMVKRKLKRAIEYIIMAKMQLGTIRLGKIETEYFLEISEYVKTLDEIKGRLNEIRKGGES